MADLRNEPRIVLYDIETTHNLAAVFKLFGEDYIDPSNLIQERYICCASWKVLGERQVSSVSVLDNPKLYEKDPHNDKYVVETLHKVLSEADVIIGHNGDAYDLKFTEGRCLFHSLSPLPLIPSIDTLKVAKSRFLFNSNKLDYLGAFLKVGRKKPTKTGLWIRVLNGDKKAVREMVSYNKQDVLLLERVFMKLRPYVANHISRELFGHTGCPRCGSKHYQSRGLHRAVTKVYQRFQCQTCGGWFRLLKGELGSTKFRVL